MLGLHKASFVVWFGAMCVHVLAYVLRVPRLVGADLARARGARARPFAGCSSQAPSSQA